jgi:DNA-binding protein H-NS
MMKKRSSADEEISVLKRELEKERELRILAERKNDELIKENEMLKTHNIKMAVRLQTNPSNPREKSSEKDNPFSRVNYYDKNKENDFKD